MTHEIDFERFVQQSLDLMCVATTDGFFQWVNPPWERVLGWKSEELLARPFVDFVHPDDRASTLSELDALKRGHLTIGFTNRYRCLDGAWRWLEWSVRPVGGGYLYANARDVTALKQTVEALERERWQAGVRERRLELAVAATSDAIWEWNLATGETFYSPRWYEMLGQEDQSCPMTFEAWKQLCHPDDFEPTVAKINATLGARRGAGYQAEFRMRHRNGSWIWILGRGNVVTRGDDGRPLLLSGTNTDITDRKLTEERQARADREIAAWKNRYDLLVLAAGQVVYDASVSGEIVWGGSVKTTLGFDPGELRDGRAQWSARLHPEDRERVLSALGRAVTKGEVFEAEYRFADQTGHYHLMHDSGYPHFGPDGKLERLVGIMADITQRRRVEQERQRLEESLRQAQKMESIGRLAGGVAHDFNNLLTAIGGNVSLITMDLDPEDPHRVLLDDVNRAVESAAGLTRQMLAFSRKQVIAPTVLDINAVIGELQKMLERVLGEDVVLKARLDPNLGNVKMDRGQIEQILVNLAANARDAMPDGGELSIETANIEMDERSAHEHGDTAPGPYVRLRVCDSGQGMSEDVRRHLFEPFFTTKDPGKGTGLGLSMVYGAVHQNHGTIAVDSRPGHGTRFSIFLPRVDARPAGLPRPVPPGPRSGQGSVLLVEDEAAVRETATRMLERLGYTVHAFANGAQALAMLPTLARTPDLLLTDVVMPGMSGRTLAEQVHALRPNIKILFTSGYNEEITARHGVAEPKIQLLAKPYSMAQLAQRVRDALAS